MTDYEIRRDIANCSTICVVGSFLMSIAFGLPLAYWLAQAGEKIERLEARVEVLQNDLATMGGAQ